jgi:hypothetical protein
VAERVAGEAAWLLSGRGGKEGGGKQDRRSGAALRIVERRALNTDRQKIDGTVHEEQGGAAALVGRAHAGRGQPQGGEVLQGGTLLDRALGIAAAGT